MMMTLIYKETFDGNSRKSGMASKIELIELDENPESAAKFAKLYQLQLPADLKNSVAYKTTQIKVS